MGFQLRTCLCVIAVILAPAALPTVAQAFPPNGGSETGTLTVPAGGTGSISTDTLPAKATQATIDMQAQEAATGDTLIDVAFFLSDIPTPSARLVACALMTYGSHPARAVVQLTQDDPTLQLLFFAICARIAAALSVPPSPAADMARTVGPQCSLQRTALPIQIRRVRGGYQGVVNSSTFAPRTRSKVTVTCRRKGSGMLITVKPRARHQTLRQAVGPKLGIGFANLGTRAAPIRVTFTAH